MRQALTAVELMVAMAIGLIVAATAFAAFRIASSSFAAAQSLSRENILLAEGYLAGVNEADFWFGQDDPYDVAGQPLRQATAPIGGASSHGAPFVPMSLPADYWNWRAMDPKTWARMGFLKSRLHGSNAQLSSINHPDPLAAWLPMVQDRIYHHLGFTGMFDYQSQHLPWGWYLGPGRANSFGQAQPVVSADFPAFSQRYWNAMFGDRTDDWGGGQTSHYNMDRNGMMFEVAHLVYPPRTGWTFEQGVTERASVANQRGIERRTPIPPGNLTELRAWAGALYSTPPHGRVSAPGWPEMVVGVTRRQAHTYAMRTVILVRVSNPLTGMQREIAYTMAGTTLRGARQQRQQAHWSGVPFDQSLP